MNTITIFSPATIANVSCGFDVLGLCLESIGDVMTIRKTKEKGVRITKIEGAALPYEAEKNVAGVAALALLKTINVDCGFEIEIVKNIKTSSGIGSSSASAAGAVFGINALLEKPFTQKELVPFAMEGERLASGTAHPDNVTPALLGGFTLIRHCCPLDIVRLPVPSLLYATVVHPKIEVQTRDARAILKATVALKNAIQQWANLGAFISALHTDDYELLSRALEDVIIEPERSVLIPRFYDVKQACLEAGALGSGISGSGPSIFALCKGQDVAKNVAKAIEGIYSKTDISFDIHISKINSEGVHIISQNP